MIDFLHPLLQFAMREVAVMGIHGFELAAIDGDDSVREQIQLPAQHNKLPADIAYAGTVVSSKIGNRFEVG